MLEMVYHRDKGNRTATRLLGILAFVHSIVWKALFGKVADSLETGTEHEADIIHSTPITYQLQVLKLFLVQQTYTNGGFKYNTSESLPAAEPFANYEHVYEVPWDTGSPWAEWHSLDDPVKDM